MGFYLFIFLLVYSVRLYALDNQYFQKTKFPFLVGKYAILSALYIKIKLFSLVLSLVFYSMDLTLKVWYVEKLWGFQIYNMLKACHIFM